MIEEDKEIEKEGKFTNAYYQGMIIEIGNIKEFKTYVPSQDKNKNFLNKTLEELVNLKDIPMFTYDHIIQKVQSIDIIWFNEREFPAYIYEIEHSTDFKKFFVEVLGTSRFQCRDVYCFL